MRISSENGVSQSQSQSKSKSDDDDDDDEEGEEDDEEEEEEKVGWIGGSSVRGIVSGGSVMFTSEDI